MNFGDIFKKSFLEGFSTVNLTPKTIVFAFGLASVFAFYIYFVYRFFTRKEFYDKSFNISLFVIVIIITGIIITIQSSLVVSLGMVGALSIVRFRTAIKNTIDLVFLFWSISIGIICGAGLPGIALLMSVVITFGCMLIKAIPTGNEPKLLVINANDISIKEKILDTIKKYSKFHEIKSQNITNGKLSLIIEIRIKDENALINALNDIKEIEKYSILHHDGEVTF